MEIYIIRHGETYWNEKGLFQGSTDIELNENGRELAGITGRQLEHTHFDMIYSSPLIRAYETACLVRGHRNIPIIRDERLKELNFGINEGKRAEDLFADQSHPFHYLFQHPELYQPVEGGETLEHICQRTREFMQQVVEPKETEWERILIAGHGAMNKAIMCYVKQHDLSQYWSGGLQQNCNVIILSFKNGHYEVLDEGRIYY